MSKREKYEEKKKNVHAVMVREIKSGNVQVGNIWLHLIRYSHLIMSIYHETNSSFSFNCEKRNIQKENDGMN